MKKPLRKLFSLFMLVTLGFMTMPSLAGAGTSTPWVSTSVAVPGATSNGNLRSVDCAGATCTAVGYFNDGSYGQGLIVSNASGSWVSTSAPTPNGGSGGDFLNAVRCVGATCTAVGTYYDGTTDQGLVVTNSSGSWVSTAIPAPNGGSNPYLTAMSCVSSTCTAVGTYYDGTANQVLVVTNSSGSWVSTSVPTPNGGSNPYLTAVSCVSSTCTAVGNDYDGTTDEGLVVTNSSGSWVSTAIPAPNGGSNAYLNAVSCVSSTCTAVGAYYDGTTDEGLVVTNSSGLWVSTAIPAPNGGSNAYLTAVSCLGSICTAAGGDSTDNSINGGVIVTNSSGSWISTSIPAPSGATYFPEDMAPPGFQAVSCSQQTCVAASAYSTASALFGFVAQSTLPPDAPFGVKVHAGNTQATISWSTSDQAGTTYSATASPGGATCTTTTTSCTIHGLRNGTTYSVRVKATNAAGTSDPSTSVSITLLAPVALVATHLAATGFNLSFPLGLAAVLVGIGVLSVLALPRRRRRI